MNFRFEKMRNRLAMAKAQLEVFGAKYADDGDINQSAVIAGILSVIAEAEEFFDDLDEEEDYDDE